MKRRSLTAREKPKQITHKSIPNYQTAENLQVKRG
jgi:hypothetical protein